MAACDVGEAIWVVMTQADGHELVDVLHDPLESEPRVEKSYAETTPLPQFQLDTPGLTELVSVEQLRDRMPDGPNSG